MDSVPTPRQPMIASVMTAPSDDDPVAPRLDGRTFAF
jgi:hypothetical protein